MSVPMKLRSAYPEWREMRINRKQVLVSRVDDTTVLAVEKNVSNSRKASFDSYMIPHELNTSLDNLDPAYLHASYQNVDDAISFIETYNKSAKGAEQKASAAEKHNQMEYVKARAIF